MLIGFTYQPFGRSNSTLNRRQFVLIKAVVESKFTNICACALKAPNFCIIHHRLFSLVVISIILLSLSPLGYKDNKSITLFMVYVIITSDLSSQVYDTRLYVRATIKWDVSEHESKTVTSTIICFKVFSSLFL